MWPLYPQCHYSQSQMKCPTNHRWQIKRKAEASWTLRNWELCVFSKLKGDTNSLPEGDNYKSNMHKASTACQVLPRGSPFDARESGEEGMWLFAFLIKAWGDGPWDLPSRIPILHPSPCNYKEAILWCPSLDLAALSVFRPETPSSPERGLLVKSPSKSRPANQNQRFHKTLCTLYPEEYWFMKKFVGLVWFGLGQAGFELWTPNLLFSPCKCYNSK